VLVVKIGEERGYAWRFAIFTILLTPVGVALIAVAVFLLVGSNGISSRDWTNHHTSFFTGMNIFFGLLPLFLLLSGGSRQRPVGKGSLAVAAGAAAVLLVISYATPLSGSPAIFWPIYGLCALLECAMLGRSYEAPDAYYVDWVRGGFDPFSITNSYRMRMQGDKEIAAVAGGIGEMIFDSYASIFASGWLIRGLEHQEIVAAAEALHALCDGDGTAAKAAIARCQPEEAGAHVLRALLRMNLVHPSETGLRISAFGERLLGRDSRPMKD